MQVDDTIYIYRALRGDQRAFAEVYARYHHRVYALVIRMVRDRDDADDLTQETFIRAFCFLHLYRFEASFSSWLFRIAVNGCLDHLNRRKPQICPLDSSTDCCEEGVGYEVPDMRPNPEEALLAREWRSVLKQAIFRLPEKYREVVLLRHQKEKSYEEVSEMLEIPIGTVKTRIFRGRRMLRKILEGTRVE